MSNREERWRGVMERRMMEDEMKLQEGDGGVMEDKTKVREWSQLH